MDMYIYILSLLFRYVHHHVFLLLESAPGHSMHSGNLPSKHQNHDDKTHVANVRAFALTSAFFSTKCFTHANAWAFCISKISDLKIKKHPFWISDNKSNQQHLKCITLLPWEPTTLIFRVVISLIISRD